MSINVRDLVLDTQKTLKNSMVVDEGKPCFKFENGKRGDQEGTTYNLLLPMMGYLKNPVKIIGEMVPSISFTGNPIPVTLVEPAISAYQDFRTGEIKLTITATGIAPVSNKKIALQKGDEA